MEEEKFDVLVCISLLRKIRLFKRNIWPASAWLQFRRRSVDADDEFHAIFA